MATRNQDEDSDGRLGEATVRKRKKRGQGEGSIYQRADGRWAAAVNLGYEQGKLKRKTFYGRTRAEVQQQLAKALAKQQQGLPVLSDGRQTIAQFLDHWLANCVKPSRRAKTYSSYEQLVRTHLKLGLGHQRLEKLGPQHVQSFLNERLESGLSARTVCYLRTVLGCALKQAMQWGLIGRNVALLASPPHATRPELTPFSLMEVRSLLEAIRGDRLEALYSTSLALGLRRGETLGLRWQDVDLQARTIRVALALQRLNGRLELNEPKTKHARRALPLPESLVAALQAHRVRQLEERLAAGDRWQDTGLVFTSSLGTPLDPRNVKRRLDAILKRAGLRHQRIHDLRHCAASLLLAQGVNLKVISEILGHSSITVTADVYAHVAPAMKRQALDLMDAVLIR